ncbi:hypothetical protein VC83_09288 [Pseudogymnoascus destructans]|uniref:GED domain-containing protein n=2 Tax=Pseudogymnoascus destructans TaxID=655981 RepID=L8FWM1_PSED2|nr:uncharacterized protein VC83_09288 [Pseudogymnoascus destructans]ELR05350.1 hypothetical protein GMDG_07333 [Pseudogymnoascus destructans 20631-21]OAF54410.1 hypothetical protein VC83_09288 [Pseudogymnoascus destructans]
MYSVKAEPPSRLHRIPKMPPARSNYQKAMVDDVNMDDFNSSFEAHGLPVPSSDTFRFTGNGSITPASEFSQTLPVLPPMQRSSAPSQESGLHIVGRRVQVLVDAINDIRGMGVDYLVDLPQLVLVGDQSAGKSSLMGALAEIHLPQDSGCCTRCPTHIKTGHAETWSCKISLNLSYNYAPRDPTRPIQANEVTKNNPFPPWREMALVTKEFVVITDKSELEEALRWAQIAILNPSKSHKYYVPSAQNNLSPNRNMTTEAKFSPNVVSVEMSGPGLPPLSFFDLPGIFQNPSQKEDDYLVKVVENLAKKYIKHQQALVIHALPMSADPTTSRAGKVIRDLKAENRTIGVLTKADCLQIGHSDAQFKELLEGRTHMVQHGYFVTKQMQTLKGSAPFSREGEYHAKSKQSEEAFFDEAYPWSHAGWKGYRNRCGTENLQRALSQKFANQIIESIPQIEATVRARSEQLETELAKLPELPTHNISQVVLQELARFGQQMQALLDGTDFGLHSSWNALNNQLYESFHELLFPMFIIRDPLDSASAVTQMEIDGIEVISLEDDSPVLDRGTFDPPSNGRAPPAKEEPQIRSPKRFANGAEKNRSIEEEVPINPFANFQSKRLVATIGEIRMTLARYTKPGAPGHIDFRAKDELCMQSVKVWKGPIQKYVELVLEVSQQQAKGILDQVLSKWIQTELYKEGLCHLDEFFNMFEVSIKKTCDDILSLEFHKLFTINNRAFDHYKEVELKKIKDARRRRRATILAEQMMRGVNVRGDYNARRNVLQQKIKCIKDEDLGEDPFRTEIDVAGLVRAYYLTAADRVCDQICLNIHSSLFKQAQESIFRYLEGKLGLDQGNTEQRCRELMEEDPQSARRRRDLQQEKANLQELTARLVKLAEDDRSASVFEERTKTPEVSMSM